MLQATCIVIQNSMGEILGVTRRDDHTKWGLPGGKVDSEDGPPDDPQTPLAGCLRELREETGVVLAPDDKVSCLGSRQEGEYQVYCYYVKVMDVGFKQIPGEGYVQWIDWGTLLNGPFGEYNRWIQQQLAN